jgi:AraC-like DNA-binding protein
MSLDRYNSAMASTSVALRAGRVVHSVLPAHEAGFTSTSHAFSLGMSFTGHEGAVTLVEGTRTVERTFGPGSIGITGSRAVAWLRTSEPTEGIDFYPTPEFLASTPADVAMRWQQWDHFVLFDADPRAWGAFARLRLAALGTAPLDELEAESLTHTLLTHIACRHFGVRPPRDAGTLTSEQFDIVMNHIHERTDDPPSLAELASVAALSPFHFLRSFKRTTGLTPHQYLTALRMEHARREIARGTRTVRQIAEAVGFIDVRHFRRTYSRTFGHSPRGPDRT